MKNFNQIATREDLAILLNIPLKKLTYILYIKRPNSFYTSFELPKCNGELRTIHAPHSDLKDVQSRLASILSSYMENCVRSNIPHAFIKGKSILTNASIHRHKRYILNIDLKDYFQHFHFGRVRGFFNKNNFFNLPLDICTIIAQLTCYNGSLPQGAPTSPIITNLICNILDMRILKITKKYGLNYTRYADDMTFSTNRKNFRNKYYSFLKNLEKEITNFGFEINTKKTRFLYNSSHQEVTGLVVNQKLNVCRTYYKETRAMANSLYTTGEFYINNSVGNITQLDGRFSFINQIDKYNNKINIKLSKDKPHKPQALSSREKEYQRFLFYKYFYSNSQPLIVTEGKTDAIYIKSALKKYYKEYPLLITQKNDGTFAFNITFLNKTKRLTYFLGIYQDGADTMKNIYNIYKGKNSFPSLEEFFAKKSGKLPNNPVFLLFDNEQKSKRPLKEFLSYIKREEKILSDKPQNICSNLYIITCPLVNGQSECEMEDLFDSVVLSHTIEGKSFCKEDSFDNTKFYGKAIFSNYIANNYSRINFEQFKPLLNTINNAILNYQKTNSTDNI